MPDVLYAGPDTYPVTRLLKCRQKSDKSFEFLVLYEGGEEMWQAAKDVSSDLIVDFLRENKKACVTNDEVYCAKKKKQECEKRFANTWFIHELRNTRLEPGKGHSILLLDGADLNSTSSIQAAIGKSAIDDVHIPNPFSILQIMCMFTTHDWVAQKVNLYGTTLNKYLRTDLEEECFTDVWFDYTGTFTGTKKQLRSKSTPSDDVALLFGRRLLTKTGLFALTYFDGRGAEKKSPQEVQRIVMERAAEGGYILENLCRKEQPLTGNVYACNDKDKRNFSCVDDTAFAYKNMKMFLFRGKPRTSRPRIRPTTSEDDDDLSSDGILEDSSDDGSSSDGLLEDSSDDEPLLEAYGGPSSGSWRTATNRPRIDSTRHFPGGRSTV